MNRYLAFGIFVILIGLGVVGNFDYADQIIIETEKKARFADEARRRADPAPIYSRRCQSRGQDIIAHQSDGGPWVVGCTSSRTVVRL